MAISYSNIDGIKKAYKKMFLEKLMNKQQGKKSIACQVAAEKELKTKSFHTQSTKQRTWIWLLREP